MTEQDAISSIHVSLYTSPTVNCLTHVVIYHITMTNVKKKEKMIYPLLCLKGKQDFFFAPMVPCIIVQTFPQLGGAKISNYGCTGMGCCCIGLSSPFPPTYSCTCACLYAYVCAAKATAA